MAHVIPPLIGRKSFKNRIIPRREKYGCWWDKAFTDLDIELQCVRWGGHWEGPGKLKYGNGLTWHFMQLKSLLWPEIVWHRWNKLEVDCYCKYRIIGELGPASSGKSHTAGTNVLADWFAWPECTTVMVSSTTGESLEMRVWGEIKRYFRLARNRWPELPGRLIEHKKRIIYDDRDGEKEGVDFRNGLVGVPCKKGQAYQGLQEYVGIKNARVRLLADELSFMPKDFIFAIANLNKNPDFKCLGLGNPKEITDALGALCEPSADLGGWNGGIDQSGGTKTWRTRMQDGIAIQLPGSDSPNLDGKLGIALITKADIEKDVAFFGKDSLQYNMMDEGRMPRGAGNRRVITRTICEKRRALEEVVWRDSGQVRIGALDAAYRGVGGDRCVFGELRYGIDVEGLLVISLVESVLVPIIDKSDVEPEEQIADFVAQQCLVRGIPPHQFGFDSTGRATLMAAFARKWSGQVLPVEFGGQATERPYPNAKPVRGQPAETCRDHYANFVTELWWSVRQVIEAGQFRGMTEDVMQEGCSREWGILGQDRGHNKIQVEPKEKMKVKTGRSPDLFDMLVTGVEVARRLGFTIINLDTLNPNDQPEPGWKRDLAERERRLWHESALHY